MDPQQRLLLETTYEALENAGIPQANTNGSNTSVHVAMFTRDYDRNVYKDTVGIPKYQVTGTGEAIMSNRISHIFNLHGPSMTIDTGCSGAMTAVSQACMSLRSGDCDIALAGAVNLIMSPDHHISMSNLHMLNAEGKSYAFDSRGAGYGRGEGVATIVMKRLDDAVRCHDPIRAVILDAVINQDGYTAGITLPSSEAQAQLERKALNRVGLKPQEVAYIEAHGTGTAAGDAAELDALSSVFCVDRDLPLYVGSVKSNIGHLEAASGMAALIKATLMLENEAIPPSINFSRPKENLRIDERNIKIPTALQPWPKGASARICVNSFGYGGTNAHAILERAPERPTVMGPKNTPYLFLLSAKSRASLSRTVKNIKEWISSQHDTLSLRDLSYTLNQRRSMMSWRFGGVATTHQELLDVLTQELKSSSAVRTPTRANINFVFTGQGAQWPGMGRELLVVRAFKDSLNQSRNVLHQLGASWDLFDELVRDKESSRLKEPQLSQPVTTAIQIALVETFRSFGISPGAVVGHSSGEIAAAYTAGYLSHDTAIKIAYYRGFSAEIAKAKGMENGAMLATDLGEATAREYVAKLVKGKATVACQNSPNSSTLSGDTTAVSELEEMLSKDSVFNRRLQVDAAYHSHHMEAAAEEYEKSLGDVCVEQPLTKVRFFSSVVGREVWEGFDSTYWTTNLTSTVRYCDALQALCRTQFAQPQGEQSHQLFVEIGPHNALAGPTRQSISDLDKQSTYSYMSALVRGSGGVGTILGVLSELIKHGHHVDLAALRTLDPTCQEANVLHDLPSYAWDHSKRFWNESRLSREYRLRKHPYHDLLGLKMTDHTPLRPSWRYLVGVEGLPWLKDHIVDGTIIFPGSGYLCMVMEAAETSFTKALIIPESPSRVELQLNFCPVGPTNGNAFHFVITAVSAAGIWAEHCKGSVEVKYAAANRPRKALDIPVTFDQISEGLDVESEAIEKISSQELYDELSAVGNTYGPMFRGINKAIIQADRSASFISIPDVTRMMPAQYMRPHFIHPTTLDILLHSSLPLVNRQVGQASIMPVRIDELALSTLIQNESGSSLAAITTLTSADLRGGDADILVFSDSGDATDRPVMSVSGLELRRLAPTGQPATSGTARDICYEMKWDADVEFISAEFLRPQKLPPSVKQKWDVIDRATDIYIQRCLQHLGKRALDASGDHHKLLVKWMNSTVAKTQTCEDPTEAKILEMSSSQGVEGEFLARLGPALPEIITGKVNPLQLMLEDGLLYRVYADDSSKRCYDLMAGYLNSKSFKQSGFAVLEIGAGTGGATLPFLQSLDHNGNRPVVFDFTDISAGLFESAKERLQDWSDVVNFRTLDIEKNPKDQGFTEGFYDIILACNVLHATSSVDSTLSKVRQLLKPEGVLLLLEVTKPRHYHNVTFGTLPGWWKGVNDSRAAGPLLSPEGWSTRMRKASLNMQLAVYDDNETPISSLIVAKPIQEVTKKKQVQIVLDSSVPIWLRKFADQVLSRLAAEEFGVSLTSWDEMTVNPHDSSIWLVIDNGEHPVLSHVTPIQLQSVTEMLKAPSHVLWISVVHDPQFSENPFKHLITGISRTAHAENDRLKMITVDVQQSICQEEGKEEGNRFMSFLMGVVISLSKADLLTIEREYVYKNGQVNIPRVLPSPDIQGWMPGNVTGLPEMKPFHDSQKAWILDIERSEFMKMPVFTENDAFRESLDENEIEIDVEAIGVPELLIRHSINGFAGRVIAIRSKVDGIKVKDNIVAFAASSYPNRLRVHQSQARVVPQGVSSRIAAALLIPLMAVSHALVNIASTNSPIVLIHGATGTIAQSSVAIAKALGSVIIQTVSGDVESPALDDVVSTFADHVVPDQGYSSKHQLQKVLRQRKVDVILSFSKNRVSKEVAGTLKPFGHCIHIENGPKPSLQIEQSQYLSNATISRFRMDAVVRAQPEAVAFAFSTVIDALGSSKMDSKAVNVVSRPVGELDRLFKQEYQHHRNESTVLHVDDCLVRVWSSEKRSLSLDSDATYVVSGGRGDLGKRFIRLMCAAGARHFVTLSRGVSSSHTQLTSLQTELQENVRNDCVLQDIQCNIADLNEVQNALAIIKTQGLPPVRGIIQAAVALEDSTMNSITSDSFNRVLGAKAHGTMNLRNTFAPEGLAFFISLSSAVTVIGTSGQSSYNAENSVQDALAQFSNRDGCHYMSLNVGTIEGADATADNQTRVQALRRQGLISITPDELLGFFRYSVTSEARKGHRCRQAIIGFTPESLSLTTAANGTVHSPMFTHVRERGDRKTSEKRSGAKKTFKATIQETRDFEKISQLMALWIGEKVANLVAADASEVDLGSSIADFYVDSLIIIELRNWINRELQASIFIPETMESQNLLSLGAKVASRSALVPSSISSKVSNSNDEALSIDSTASLSLAPSSQPPEMLETPYAQLQHLPAADLHTALDMLIESRKGFCTQAELEETLRASAEWRGVEKADRDAIVSKFTGSNLRLESYEKALHLERREPLQDHAVFYLGHITDQVPDHTQAERAAIIVHSTLSFKHQLEMGVLEQNSLNGSPLCMSTLQWLFHATQEPRHELDVMKKYRASGNVAIMRRGHIFVATVHDDDGLAALVALFEDVIQHSEDAIPALSILTSHRRDDWAQLKGSLESITGNAAKLEAIQSAAFVICLDEGAPTNPGERATSQLLNDRHLSNRWLDKTLQFSVAANGVSSLIGLNSTLDGLSVKQLHEAITEQILASTRGHMDILHQDHERRPAKRLSVFRELGFEIPPPITTAIEEKRLRNLAHYPSVAAFSQHYADLNRTFLGTRRLRSKGTVLMAIVFAIRLFYGRFEPVWETVTLAKYARGRTDWLQIVTPDVMEWIESAIQRNSGGKSTICGRDMLVQLQASTTKHTQNVRQVADSRGFVEPLYAFQAFIESEGRKLPRLFKSEAWKHSDRNATPKLVKTDCLGSGGWLRMQEAGFLMPHPNSLFIHYEVHHTDPLVLVQGRDRDVAKFSGCLNEAVKAMRTIIEQSS
uniref:Highly reducing polyketide synthase AFT9-1 n=1 Tax=Alternaria alternata TaxID=5599 RepID=AFT91_ALTAL|nr:RecName: Full=Highly reducing polyketide synthase AFT9-1; Short=HR-PKS AFT9-1; AltName: Full=AF-toxin biosynthesis protein 9-1 [Alternaria alternata]BAD97694.1 Aft9-1 [Alternaria alternata]